MANNRISARPGSPLAKTRSSKYPAAAGEKQLQLNKLLLDLTVHSMISGMVWGIEEDE